MRLWIPRAVPTEAVGNCQTGLSLPLVLPVQAQSGLVVGEERVRREGIQPIQPKALEVEVGIRCRRWGRQSRTGIGIGIEIAKRTEVVPAGAPPGEGVFAIYERIYITAKLHIMLGEGVGEVVLYLELAIVVIARQIESLA